MFRAVLVGLLLSLSSGAFAFKFPIEMIEGVDGARIIVYFNEEDLEADVRWTPFEDEPPVSVGEALAAVRTHVVKNASLGDVTLRDIQLRRIPHHNNDWHYMVVLQSQREGKPVPHYYAVLMTGKVIPAILEPESYK